MAQNNPWKEQQTKGTPGLTNKFEQLAQPKPKPQIIRGKTTWSDTGNSGDWHNDGKFQKKTSKPKKSDFGPAPKLSDLP